MNGPLTSELDPLPFDERTPGVESTSPLDASPTSVLDHGPQAACPHQDKAQWGKDSQPRLSTQTQPEPERRTDEGAHTDAQRRPQLTNDACA